MTVTFAARAAPRWPRCSRSALHLRRRRAARARKRRPPSTPPAPTPWSSLSAEEQKVLSRYSERWNSLPRRAAAAPAARHAALAGDDARAARAGAGALRRWQELTPEQRELRAQALARLPRAAARAAGSACARTITGSRSSRPSSASGCASAGRTPRRKSGSRCWSAAGSGMERQRTAAAVANYCAVDGAGVGGIFFVLVPGLAQLIT